MDPRSLRGLLIALIVAALAGCQALAPLFARPRPTTAGAATAPAHAAGSIQNRAALAGATAGNLGAPPTDLPGQAGTPALDPGHAPLADLPKPSTRTETRPVTLSGKVLRPQVGERSVQASPADVVTGATVTLLGAGNQAVATTLTDGQGGFSLTIANFNPATDGSYVVEVVKGLRANTPGRDAARFRTIVKWTGSDWLSISNGTPDGEILVSSLTTAVALTIALDSTLSQELAIGKVDGTKSPPALNSLPAFPGHPDAEIAALAKDIASYLTNDLDPVGSVNALKPSLTSLEPQSGFPGTLVTMKGSGFSPVPGGNTVTFGSAGAAVYLATAGMIIASVPKGASTGDVTVSTERGGKSSGLPFTVTSGLKVAVKTNGIVAPYYVAGAETTAQPGNRTVVLYPGTAQIVFTTGQSATFVVGQDGAVDAAPSISGGALTGGQGQVAFNVMDLAVRPNGYSGTYSIGGGFMAASVIGDSSVQVLKGLGGYQLWAGPRHLFDIDAAGTVVERGTWASGTGGQITFSNIPLQINANGYAGTWSINGVSAGSQTGNMVVQIPKDSTGYVFNVLGTAYSFDVSSTGETSTTNPYATGGSKILTLNMISLAVEAKGFTGQYHIPGVTGWLRGDQSIVLMRSFTYRILFWPGNSYVQFHVGATGGITVQNAGGQASTGAVTVPASGKIAFNTTTVNLDMGGWKGNVGILYGQRPGNWTWLMTDAARPNWVRENSTYTLLHGMTNYYYLYFSPGTLDHYLNFHMADSGLLTSVGTGAKVTDKVAALGTRSIALNTATVPVATNGYTGRWGLLYGDGPARGWTWLTSDTGDPNWVIGNRTFTLLEGLVDYFQLYFWPGNGTHYLILSVDGSSNVTRKTAPEGFVSTSAVTTGLASIALNTDKVSTKTNGWLGNYAIWVGESPQRGWTWLYTDANDRSWVSSDKTWTFVRGIKNYYWLYLYPGGVDYNLNLDLDGAGTLKVAGNGAKVTQAMLASLANRTLSFSTTPDIEVGTNGWRGNYAVMYGNSPTLGWTWLRDNSLRSGWFRDARTYKFLRGLVDYYHVYFWPGNNSYYVTLNVDSAGVVETTSSGPGATTAAVTGGLNSLSVNTRPVQIQTNGWRGLWGFLYGGGPTTGWSWLTSDTGDPNWVSQDDTYVMVKGLVDYYFMYFWPGANTMWLNVNLDKNDTFTATAPDGGPVTTDAVTLTGGASPKITFATSTITVKPNNYQGLWALRYGTGASSGGTWLSSNQADLNWVRALARPPADKTYTLLKGIPNYYWILYYPGRAEQYMGFSLAANGNVSYSSAGDAVTSAAASFSGSTITFQTHLVPINVNGYDGLHGIQYGGNWLNYYGNGPITTGWSWLTNESGRTGWVNGGSNNTPDRWYLLKGMKNYYIHVFYPGGTWYYRAINLSSTGAPSFPNDGENISSNVYSTANSSGLTLNVATITLYPNNYHGYHGLRYGRSRQSGWQWLRDENAVSAWHRFTGTNWPDSVRKYKILKGLDDYYFLMFWPDADYFLALNYNVSSSKFEVNTGNSGLDMSAAAIDVGTANALKFNTRRTRVRYTNSLGTKLWTVHTGNGVSYNVMEDEAGAYDYATTNDRYWYLMKGMTNYFWVRVDSQNQGGGFTTSTTGTVSPTSVSLGGTTFSISPQ